MALGFRVLSGRLPFGKRGVLSKGSSEKSWLPYRKGSDPKHLQTRSGVGASIRACVLADVALELEVPFNRGVFGIILLPAPGHHPQPIKTYP